MTKRYQVVGECAHVVARDHTGVSAMRLLYKGAYLPDGVDEDRLQHLLDSGLVAEEPGVPVAPNSPLPQDTDPVVPSVAPDSDGIHPVVTEDDRQQQRAKQDADAEVEQKRAAARAKLKQDADGKFQAPHANAGEDVWVEYAVTQGLDYAEASKAGKSELQKALAK